MNIWKYRKFILDDFKNILFDCICDIDIPIGIFKKYIIRKNNINKYDISLTYITSYFKNSPIYVIGYHLQNDKWYSIYDSKYHRIKGHLNLQFFFKYNEVSISILSLSLEAKESHTLPSSALQNLSKDKL